MRRHAKGSFAGSTSGRVRGGAFLGKAWFFALCLLAMPSAGVAPAAAAENCPNASVRSEQSSLTLPECRAYELVTPMSKGGAMIPTWAGTPTSPTGDRIGYISEVSFGGGAASLTPNRYLAARGASGWQTTNINPPSGEPFRGYFSPGVLAFSPDLTKSIALAWGALTPEAAPQIQNLYIRDEETGAYSLLTKGLPEPLPTFAPIFRAASTDFRHVIFESTEPLTADAPLGVTNLYQWDEGVLSLVNILPSSEGGGPSPSGGVAGAGEETGAGSRGAGVAAQTMSDDGSRVVFSTPGNGQLYMRIDGSETVRLNASEASSPAPSPMPAKFVSAIPSGSRVFFSTNEALVDADTNAGTDLYMYDATKPAGDHNLTLISRDDENVDGDTPGFRGVIGTSRDGSYVYFVTNGALTSTTPPYDTESLVNVYLWHDGVISYVAHLAQGEDNGIGDGANWASGVSRYPVHRVTPDGKYMIFMTNVPVLPGVSAFEQISHQLEVKAIYRYSADSGTISCVTCLPADPTRAAGATFGAGVNALSYGTGHYISNSRNISDDGRHIFFETSAQLVAADVNDQFDVYEWFEGQTYLISGGRGAGAAQFADASTDGSSVFFFTNQQLAPQDTDSLTDIYDARVGGGFPASSTPEGCQGEACQGPPAPAAAGVVAPGSSQISAAVNAKARAHRKSHKPRRHKKRHKAKHRKAKRHRKHVRVAHKRVGRDRNVNRGLAR